MDPVFFSSTNKLMAWFEKNHARKKELWVGYYKRATGKKSITWPESVDAALCYGWIDGIRRSIGTESYMIRFTPRNPDSTWSAVNLKKMEALIKQGLMKPAGLAVYKLRRKDKSENYSFQRHKVMLDEKLMTALKQEPDAWGFFSSQAPYYRKICFMWIMDAKKEETRLRRLGVLISCSAKREKIPSFQR